MRGSANFTVSISELNPQRTYVEVQQLVNGKWNKISGAQSTGDNANKATLAFNTVGLDENAKYQFKISSDDQARNHAGSTVAFSIDNTGPTITVKNGYVGNKDQKVFSNVSFSLYDKQKVDYFTLNGKRYERTNNSYSDANFQDIKAGLKQGETNSLKLYDVAGNSSEYVFTYDSVAPTGTLEYSPAKANGPTNQNVTVTLITSEKIDESLLPNDWNLKGENRYEKIFTANQTESLVLKDNAGNTKNITVEVDWIDKTAPNKVEAVTLYDDDGEVTNGYTNDYNVTVKWNKVNDTVKYEYCYWNNVSTSNIREDNCYTTYPTSEQQSGELNQGEGTHYVKVRAIDAAGNVGEFSETLSFVYDKTAPLANGGDDRTVTNNTVNMSASSDDTTASYSWTQVSGPGAVINEPSNPKTGVSLTDYGTYVFRVTTSDKAGNTSSDDVTVIYEKPTDSTDTNQSGDTADTDTSSTGRNIANTAGGSNAAVPTLVRSLALNTSPLAINPAGNAATDTDNDEAEILGASDKKSSSDEKGDVLAATDDKTGCAKFLGLCWYWWIPITVAVVGAIWFYLAARRDNDPDPFSGPARRQ